MRVPTRHSLYAAAAAAALCTTSLVSASEAATDGPDDVLVISQANYTKTVEAHPLALLEFYAPWCGHCNALAPEYKKAATQLKDQGIALAKIDCTVETALCQEVGVGGYPTLKIYRGKTDGAAEYSGPRKADGIVSYMLKQNQPALTHLTSASEADKLKKQDKVVAIAYVSSSSADKKALEAFRTAAEKERDSYTFGYVDSADLAKAAGIKTFPSIVIYRSFDEPELHYPSSDPIEAAAIESFVKDASVPLIDQVGPENFRLYADAGLPIVYYFTEPNDPKKDAILEDLKPVAKEFKGKVNFVWIDAVKFAQHAETLNLKTEVWPAAAIQDMGAHTKFPLQQLGVKPAETIKTFVSDFVNGKLQPSIKSEPVPATQSESVFVLVADEFDKVVNDHSKDLLVEFYAPWCGHCKKLEPTFAALGEKYAAHKDQITIAKMDATKNDIPPSAGFSVEGFPTIKFRPAGPASKWIDFHGERSLEGFVDFIGVNGKNKLDVGGENATGKTTPHATEEEKPAPPKKAEVVHEEL
ncbi:hypothetical protein A4X09_0g7196 [Tilletia walkeri]|uniref:Protein disulfide-isomerase n=1 Tax=Tilletia walkeri TaxID=117179 RepID=A0A8X7T1N5_9BASI|nr:hypothetical protein A4X09_0g7196 [Tilletia walkeri]